MSKKFNASSIVILLSGLLSCAAGVLFQSRNGVFGQMLYNYYNPFIAWGLMGVVAVAVVLMLCKLHGLASLAVTAVPGLAFCAFFITSCWARSLRSQSPRTSSTLLPTLSAYSSTLFPALPYSFATPPSSCSKSL